ncbi:hypothetical protein [Sphingopyxis sp. RIFCSPHIGHO2_12_FULL_65_19]|uniref:hypothetical protein n=1 Tax=Sphingopyxis sp. RIFCSPHIGHO2_12_FULL_65_19 TaxID=1802172 RepID=UPI0025D941ED|nr:hypothetical protein [Sphingopyxis sp. RIFCSPHIGHO2_12_FULL_65_19]
MRSSLASLALLLVGCGGPGSNEPASPNDRFANTISYEKCIDKRASELGPRETVNEAEARAAVKTCSKFLRGAAIEIAAQFDGKNTSPHNPYVSVEFNEEGLEHSAVSKLTKDVAPKPVP